MSSDSRQKLLIEDPSAVTVLAGPTAVGKGTVSQFIRENYPDVWLSVSATTRDKRPGEQEGVEYFFLSATEFENYIDQGRFLEWAQVHGQNYYGTLASTVQKAINQGQKVLLEIDLQGARQVRRTLPGANFIFLAPPSWDELVKRLVGRGTERPKEQERRLKTARQELAAESEFDQTIINDSVDQAAAELVAAMKL